MAKPKQKGSTKKPDAAATSTAQPAAGQETAGQDQQPAAGQDQQPPANQETAGQDQHPAAGQETAGQDEQPAANQEPAGQDEQPQGPEQPAGQDHQPAPDDGGGAKREGKVKALQVTAKGLDRFYRCGLKFTRTPRTLAVEDLEPDHVKRIEAEPRLVAARVTVDASEVEVLNR